MADPLTILRGVLLDNQTPTIEGDDYILGRYKFNKNTPTAFKGSTGSNYNLGSVYFLHSNRSLNHGAYILAASRSNVQAVAFNDKKELLQYLDGGEITSSIVFDSIPASTPTMIDSTISSDIPTLQQEQITSTTTASSLSTTLLSTTTSTQQEQIIEQTTSTTSTNITTTSLTTQQQEQDNQLQTSQQYQQQDDDYNNSNYNDQYQDMAIQDFDEMDKISYSKSSSDQMMNKIDPLLLHDKELTPIQQRDKQIFQEKIDADKVKPDIPITEDSYLEKIREKRKNPFDDKSSSFIIADQDVTKAINEREKKSSDKVSILQSTTHNFNNICDSYKKFKSEEEEEKRRKSRPSSSSNGNKPSTTTTSTKSSTSSSNGLNPSTLKNRTPIIIVPSSLTSPISLFNVLEFLQNSLFRPTLEKKQEMASQNIMKPPMITFDRISSQKVTYEIIDNIKSLKPEDWSRVVAAFIQGEAWQFKDWKWSNPTELFSNIKGFYVKFDDANVPDVVKSWDVKILHISKSKRHLDQTAQVEFWNAFDEFVNYKKPYLNH